VIVAGLKVIVVPSESPDALSVSGAVDAEVRENVNVAGTVAPCLAIIGVGATDRFTGRIWGGPSPPPASVALPPHAAAKTIPERINASRIRNPRRLATNIVRQ
jgi:hypothetical protein